MGLLLISPILILFMLLVWFQDFNSPFYFAPRMLGRGKKFKMVKLRSMVVHADKLGGTSTAGSDDRITWVGHIIRKFKLDELTQLWNVLKGEMSLVGPRPQAEYDANLYSEEEMRLLDIKPGITDFSSIVFADEGDILSNSIDPDLKYNQVIRPWKSRLGLVYVDKNSISLDFKLILLTIISIFSRKKALYGVNVLLGNINACGNLRKISLREDELIEYPPPGFDQIVKSLPRNK